MGDLIQGLFVMIVGGLFVGTTGLALAILWLRATSGNWPDRDTVVFLTKVFYGIGLLGIVMFLFLKYA